MSLTPNEIAILSAIDKSEYGDRLTDSVWTFTLADHSGLSGKTISGTVSSLAKKGFVVCTDYEASSDGRGRKNNDDAAIGITDAGVKALLETGYKPRKMLD